MGMNGKICSACGTASGGLSILGGANVCHTACMGIVSLLSLIGITIAGMPLMFLQKWALPLWTVAVVLLIAMAALAHSRAIRFSPKTMLANAGLIIAGTPFAALNAFQWYFWTTGGALVTGSIAWALHDWRSK